MPTQYASSRVRIGTIAALVLVLAGCTPGGQFDPTEVLNSDMFSTKKKLQGDREPLFPNGVPGAETGVPPDLIKGYQPPPEPAQTAEAAAPAAPAAAAPANPKPKLRPKPKPKVVQAPAAQAKSKPHDPAWDQKPAQAGQANWPSPPPAAQPAQTNWPAPSAGAPAQQTAAPAQTNWPSPPPSGTFSH